MSWIVIALAAGVAWAGVSIVDKTLLQNYFRSHVTLWLAISILQGITGLVFVGGFAWSNDIASTGTLWALVSGAINGFGGLFLLYALKSREVSRVAPIAQTSPIFAPVLAFVFLDETLTLLQWLGVATTVAGALLLSTHRDAEYHNLSLDRSFFPIMLASVFMAVGQVVSKVPLDTLSVPFVHGLRSLGTSTVLFGASVPSRDARQDLMRLVRSRSKGLALVVFGEMGLGTVAILLFLWALSMGPVGLVSALGATRALFVLLFSTLLTLKFGNLLGERVTRGVLGFKLASITLIVAGVGAIALS